MSTWSKDAHPEKDVPPRRLSTTNRRRHLLTVTVSFTMRYVHSSIGNARPRARCTSPSTAFLADARRAQRNRRCRSNSPSIEDIQYSENIGRSSIRVNVASDVDRGIPVLLAPNKTHTSSSSTLPSHRISNTAHAGSQRAPERRTRYR